MRLGWSLESRLWRDVAGAVSAHKWHKVPFDELSRDMVPRDAGVYAICTSGTKLSEGLFGELYNAVYVGKAKSLRVRFRDHCERPQREIRSAITAFPSLEFWFMRCPVSEVDSLETMLIDCLGPSANRQRGIAARFGESVAP